MSSPHSTKKAPQSGTNGIQKTYIPEIDTFRALAVLLVIIFHAWPAVLPGGFIGVDIFFTISGFVISRSYLYPLINREITLSDFYLSRFRRLAPALLVVLAITTLVAAYYLLPDQLVNFSRSLMAQAIYMQNFVFWEEGDYFSGAITKPLLHTWSLAVEEQFYILWALLILLFRRYPKLILVITLLSAAGSITFGFLLEPRSPKTVFFLLPTRIWEFALGIVAFLAAKRLTCPSGIICTYTATTAVIVILLSAALFDEKSPFPGQQSLIACLATGIALFCLDRTVVSTSVLNLRPVLYLGKISYGLYLWHWPPIVLFFLIMGQRASPFDAALLMVLAILGAMSSFHFLEQPIRYGPAFRKPHRVFAMVGTGFALIMLTGVAITISKGFISRYPEPLQPLLVAPLERGKFRCGQIYVMTNPTSEMCQLTNITTSGGLLIIGDSHADVLKELLTSLGENYKIPIWLTTRNCDLGRFGTYAFCSTELLNKIVKEAFQKGISDVIAISYWETDKFDTESLEKDLGVVVRAGLYVHLMKVVPNHASYDPKKRALAVLSGNPLNLNGMRLDEYEVLSTKENEIFLSAKNKYPDKVSILSPADYLCPNGFCLWSTNGIPNYLDSNHLTFTGTKLLIPMFTNVFHNMNNRIPGSSEEIKAEN